MDGSSPLCRTGFIDDLKSCYFYHTTDVPPRRPAGEWTCAPASMPTWVASTPGPPHLEIGPASGFLTLRMEPARCEVVAFDCPRARPPTWSHTPSPPGSPQARASATSTKSHAFWLCHRLLGSRTHASTAALYAIPMPLARWMLHLRCVCCTYAIRFWTGTGPELTARNG